MMFQSGLHVIPVGDNAVLDGVLQGQHTCFSAVPLNLVSFIRSGIAGRIRKGYDGCSKAWDTIPDQNKETELRDN